MLFLLCYLTFLGDGPLFCPRELLWIVSEGLMSLYSDKYSYTKVFNFVTIRTTISLVGLLKPLVVCIIIMATPNFPIWNSFPFCLELFSVPLLSFS